MHKGVATFRAVQVALGRNVLVSVLAPKEAKLAVNREHFHRRQQVASRLHHENIVSTIDAGTHKGCRYFVTEHVEGRTLAQEIASKKKLPAVRAAAIGRDVAKAIAYLDAERVVHRNITPASILLTDAEVVKLSGFEAAKDSRPGAHETWQDHDGESALYLAPEFLVGERGIDVRADVYSLGCILYHMVTGHAPFAARSAAVVLESHAKAVPTDPRELVKDLPADLVAVIDRCLRKRREHRYAKADDAARDLEHVRTGRPIEKPPGDGALWPTTAAIRLPLPRLKR
jgi:serine/threonine-protein kinase